jgi:PAS domain S-box-containing protein
MTEKRLYNSLIAKSYLEYLENYYPNLDTTELLEYAGIASYEVTDRGHWLTQSQVNRFHEYMQRRTGNPDLAREVGRYISSPQSGVSNILHQSMAGFLSPAMAYWAVEKISLNQSRHISIKSRNLRENEIELLATPNPGVKEESFQCNNRIGMFEAIARIFTGKFATVDHPECIHRGDPHCRYLIRWSMPRSLLWKRIGSYAILALIPLSLGLLAFLPVHGWLIATLLVLSGSLGTLLFGSFLRNKEMAANLRQQGITSNDVVNQINFRHNESELVREIGEAISSILDQNELLDFITEALHKRLMFERSMVMLANPERTKLVFRAGRGFTQKEAALSGNLEFSLTNPESRGYFYQTFINQKPFFVDIANLIEPNLSQRSSKLIKDLGIRSFICVPIVFKGRSEGVLAVDITHAKTKTTQSEVSLLVGIARQIGISLNNARVHKEIAESEQRFRNLSDNTPDIIYRLDDKGTIRYVNQAWKEILGHDKATLEGKCLCDFLGTTDRKTFTGTIKNVITNKLRVRDSYFTIASTRGMPRQIVLSAAPDFDADGKVIGVVGTIKDISALRGMEAQLLQASKMEAVGTLTGGIAHDFNNIIQAIMGYNQLMLAGRLGNEADLPYLKSIADLITRSRELVRQLLMFSKKVEPVSKTVNINDEIKSIHSLLVKSIPKMIEIKTELAESIFPVKAEATQIGQIIMNLVINARDAIGDTGVITVKTGNLIVHETTLIGRSQVAPGRYVQLSVTDTGHGMDEGVIRHIFDPFFTTKEPGAGTGLGLAVVLGIVKNHKGVISCTSSPGCGTTFHILLPASATAFAPLEEPAAQNEIIHGTEKLLVVDDEISILETVKDTIMFFGYHVETAQSGEEALKIYTKQKDEIDLVVLDLIMPGAGGKKCLHAILEINPEAKVLMTSGYVSASQAEELSQAGAAGFIHKPYRPEDLLLNIRRLFDGQPV